MMNQNQAYPLYQLQEIHDLKHLIDEQARIHPQAPAFRWMENKALYTKTRLELRQDIRALTNWLFDQKIHGQTIALVGRNSYAYIVAFFALILAGNVAAPIDKDAASEEIVAMMTLGDASGVVCAQDDPLVSCLPDSIQPLWFEDFPSLIEKGKTLPDHFESVQIDPETICAYFYTSGTTGTPKAVMLSHKNIAADINAACKNFVLTGDTVAVLPFHHCFGLVTGVLKVLNYGKATYIAPSLRRVQKTFQEQKPQTVFLVPLFVETFHKRIWSQIKQKHQETQARRKMRQCEQLLKIGIDMRKKTFKAVHDSLGGALQYIICGGAPLDQRYIDDFHAWGITILNGYGITECAPVVAVNRNHFIKKNSVGQIVDGVQVRIGEQGEVWVKGDIVMRGYYGDPEATRAVLRDGWFNTQDIGYVDRDNFLFLNGREKNLIILSNGENVSPEQIEMQLARCEEIEEVIVFARQKALCAEIYPDPAAQDAENKIAAYVQAYNDRQPRAKQIERFYFRDREFEKTPTKKIIRSQRTGV